MQGFLEQMFVFISNSSPYDVLLGWSDPMSKTALNKFQISICVKVTSILLELSHALMYP